MDWLVNHLIDCFKKQDRKRDLQVTVSVPQWLQWLRLPGWSRELGTLPRALSLVVWDALARSWIRGRVASPEASMGWACCGGWTFCSIKLVPSHLFYSFLRTQLLSNWSFEDILFIRKFISFVLFEHCILEKNLLFISKCTFNS